MRGFTIIDDDLDRKVIDGFSRLKILDSADSIILGILLRALPKDFFPEQLSAADFPNISYPACHPLQERADYQQPSYSDLQKATNILINFKKSGALVESCHYPKLDSNDFTDAIENLYLALNINRDDYRKISSSRATIMDVPKGELLGLYRLASRYAIPSLNSDNDYMERREKYLDIFQHALTDYIEGEKKPAVVVPILIINSHGK